MRLAHRALVGAWLALAAFAPHPALAAPGGEVHVLVPADPETFHAFGWSVALEGGQAAIGAPQDTVNLGSVYLFDVQSGAELRELKALDATPGDVLGRAVALDGGRVVAGAEGADAGGLGSGAVYVFEAATGAQLHKLVAADGAASDELGCSVAADGGLCVAGAWNDDDNGQDSGSAYVFDLASGQQLAKLLPSDGAAGDWFGFSVALSGGLAFVGAPNDTIFGVGSKVGSVYVFDAASGAQLAKLVAAQPVANAYLGWSVAASGSTVVAGAWGDGDGAAHVFDAAGGAPLAVLRPQDGLPAGNFGLAVAVEGARAVVCGDPNGIPHPPAAYLFDLPTGSQIARLTPSDGYLPFGSAVALDGGAALIGCADQFDAGRAYVFDATQAIAVPYCFGRAPGAPCPCGNVGFSGHGCANGDFASGALLSSSGAPCVATDDLVLHASSTTRGGIGLFFQGDAATAGGAGAPFGDGLRCAEGNELRLEVAAADAGGAAASSVSLAAAAGVAAGDVRRYQWWYRDPVGSPCGSGFNLSNGLEVVWGP